MGVIEALASSERKCVNEIFPNDTPEVITRKVKQAGQRVMALHRRWHTPDARVDGLRLNFGSGEHPDLHPR